MPSSIRYLNRNGIDIAGLELKYNPSQSSFKKNPNLTYLTTTGDIILLFTEINAPKAKLALEQGTPREQSSQKWCPHMLRRLNILMNHLIIKLKDKEYINASFQIIASLNFHTAMIRTAKFVNSPLHLVNIIQW